MNINPHNATYTDTWPIDSFNDISTMKKKFDELAKGEEIVAIGPEDHLRALQQDLLKAGYRKIKRR